MFRSILAVLSGTVMAMAVIIVVEACGQWLNPLPEGFDASDAAALQALIEADPSQLLFILFAWTFAALAGAALAAWVAPWGPYVHAAVIIGLVMVGAFMTMGQLPHPQWFVPVAPLAVVLGGLFGAMVGTPKTSPTPTAAA
jgi:hypothetical protein